MSYRGRPVNCHLTFGEMNEKLWEWLEKQIINGNADNYIWDRIDSMNGIDFERRFGKVIEVFISDGVFDEAVTDRAEGLGYEKT